MSIAFTVRGKAHPQGRPRFYNGRAYTSAADREWHQKVVDEWERCSGRRILDGAYVVTIDVYEKRPKTHLTKANELSHAGRKADHPARGDLDNYAKGVIDALVRREVIPDDRYMVRLHVSKSWGEEASTNVLIERHAE